MNRWCRRLLFLAGSAVMAVTAAAGEGDLPRNFHQVDAENRIFRSAQPDREEFLELERRGFRTILNLRNFHSDRRKIRGLKLREFPVPCNAGSMTEAHLARALQILRDEPKPLLIHCWHGSDRTGTVVAAFRIVFNGWETEAAIGEMCREEYGHHAGIYDNLPELLRSIDWGKMRSHLQSADWPAEPFRPEQVLRIEYTEEPFQITADGESAAEAASALELVHRVWRRRPYRIALLVFDRNPGNSLYEPFAARLNRLPELESAVRIDAVPAERCDETMRERCRRLGLEADTARELRVVPHRVIWTPPAEPVQKKSGE